jgi:hypothetical protein
MSHHHRNEQAEAPVWPDARSTSHGLVSSVPHDIFGQYVVVTSSAKSVVHSYRFGNRCPITVW